MKQLSGSLALGASAWELSNSKHCNILSHHQLSSMSTLVGIMQG